MNHATNDDAGEEESGSWPVLLGRRFRVDGLPGVYTVLGIKGRAYTLVLEESTTGEILKLPYDDFLARSVRDDA